MACTPLVATRHNVPLRPYLPWALVRQSPGVCPNFHLLYSWQKRKKFYKKKKYFHILTRPLRQILTLIAKLVSNSSMKYQKGMIFVIGISGEMTGQTFKIVL